jgi:hypothetical protein
MTVSTHTRPASTAWKGWAIFGAVMLLIAGTFQSIAGFTALFNDDYYLVGSDGLVVHMDYTAWGWVHVAIGVLLLIGGVSLLSGGVTGRIVGVVAAALSAIANLMFLAAYPVWSAGIIALDVLIIYAIVVHGNELES